MTSLLAEKQIPEIIVQKDGGIEASVFQSKIESFPVNLFTIFQISPAISKTVKICNQFVFAGEDT